MRSPARLGPWKLALAVCAGAVLAVLASSLTLARWLPIYTDEIWWKAFRSRLFLDHGYASLHGLHLCTSHAAHPEPMFFLPFRVLDAWIYQDMSNPLKLRIGGIAQFLVLLSLAIVMVARSLRCQGWQWGWAVLGVAAFFGLGVLPFAMVMNRPEPLSVICLLGLALLALSQRPSLVLSAFAFVLGTGAIAYSIRALYFTPWVALALWKTARSRPLQIALLVGWLAISVTSYRFYSAHASCPELPAYAGFIARYRVNPADLVRVPLASFARIAENVVATKAWFTHPEFKDRYMSDWLPPRRHEATLGDEPFNAGIRLVYALWFVPGAILCLWPLVVPRASRIRADARYQLGLALAVCLIASSALVNYKNDYEVLLALPLALLALALIIGGWTGNDRAPVWLGRWIVAGVALCAVVSLASMIHLRQSFAAIADASWKRPGGVYAQPYSTSTVRTPESSQLVRTAAAACGIVPARDLDRLVVDDWTISEFWEGTRPQYVFFLTTAGGIEFGAADFFETYRHSDAPGLITQCHFLPPQAQARAIHTRGLCCLPPASHFSSR